jgi:type III secretion system FlhB-like substrate exporter
MPGTVGQDASQGNLQTQDRRAPILLAVGHGTSSQNVVTATSATGVWQLPRKNGGQGRD